MEQDPEKRLVSTTFLLFGLAMSVFDGTINKNCLFSVIWLWASKPWIRSGFSVYLLKKNEREKKKRWMIDKDKRNICYLSCHTVGHIPEEYIDLSKLNDSFHSLWSTGHDTSWMARCSRCGLLWCHCMHQSIVVAKVMWWLAGNWYPMRAIFWSVN